MIDCNQYMDWWELNFHNGINKQSLSYFDGCSFKLAFLMAQRLIERWSLRPTHCLIHPCNKNIILNFLGSFNNSEINNEQLDKLYIYNIKIVFTDAAIKDIGMIVSLDKNNCLMAQDRSIALFPIK